MKTAVAQIDCVVGDWHANLRLIEATAGDAAAQDCRLLILPELCDLGYDIPTVLAGASVWGEGHFAEISRVAATHRLWIAAGLAERDHEGVFNTVAVFSPNGAAVARYRKVHLYSAEPVCEHKHLVPGTSLTVFPIEEFTAGILICYDLRFPEIARAMAVAGADLLIVCSAFTANFPEHWEVLLQARAIENQTWVLAANRIGTDNGVLFCGRSRIISPQGEVTAAANGTAQILLTGDISLPAVQTCRTHMKVFDERRPSAYNGVVNGLPDTD